MGVPNPNQFRHTSTLSLLFLFVYLGQASPSLDACLFPSTFQNTYSDTCASLGTLATSHLDVSGAKGEREHFQVLLALPESAVGSVSVSVSGLDKFADVHVWQVGYVNCTTTHRYSPSGGGWRPDPLLLLTPTADGTVNVLVSPGANPLWFSLSLGSNAGTTDATISLTFTPESSSSLPALSPSPPMKAELTLSVTVWDLQLPNPEELHSAFGEIWSFSPEFLSNVYPADSVPVQEFYDLMTDALLPPDSLYKGVPYANLSVYEYLANTGAVLLNLGNVGQQPTGCPDPYTPKFIAEVLESLRPAVEFIGNMSQSNLRPYVYGYDEEPPSCEANIRALYGAIKQEWPQVTTVATLNWEGGLPADLPVDIWVLQYEEYNASEAAVWKKAGKEQFWYHCIEPSGSEFLNTFIERPRVHGRLLYWLAVLNDVDGWLYYATDLWKPYPGMKHTPLKRISSHSPLTDFDPSNYIWDPRTDIFANGDGQFVYPGPLDTAPAVPSQRLWIMRDAVEDQFLLSSAMKKDRAEASRLIRLLVRSPVDHTDDPLLLEQTRLLLAKIVLG